MENDTVNVRYMVENVETSTEWYVAHLAFRLSPSIPPVFAKRPARRTSLTVERAIKFSRPPDGRWGSAISSASGRRSVPQRRRSRARRSPGLLVDPSDNLVELFQPARR